MTESEQIELEIEKTVGLLYSQFYKLRKLNEYQLEYYYMEIIINMLIEDRQCIRENYKDKLNT